MSVLRPSVDGKFFRLGASKFFLKGLAYGPFRPNEAGEAFASPAQTAQDFRQIRDLGANLLRVYEMPPQWLLDLAAEHDIKLLVDIPWPKHLCFLDSPELQTTARESVRRAVTLGQGHPAVFAYSVANEISPDIVRWSGLAEVSNFIEELIDLAKQVDPECLCTYTSFPPTEFLRPHNVDFFCYNVYLHQPKAFENYLARLQMLADTKPLVLGEFGMDSLHEGEARQRDLLAWQIESAFRAGLAGAVAFSFTDDWFRGGYPIENWAFGLTTRERRPKPALAAVQRAFAQAPYFPLSRYPKVSIVVACYNGARSLKICLESLQHLNYPDFEVILVDDGSTDATPDIARSYPNVRYLRQANYGLSVARNTGMAAAQGEIIAFTDADCRADEDWLYYLVGDMLRGEYAGIGGPNFLPPEDSLVAAAVIVSPGGPAHVMLTDREAEHVPGCNMAFYKWALEELGGFDPVFHNAGDDVDICWRLLERGFKLGFSPAGFVWHFRRSTMPAYLKQQRGYGEAEALLARKHPEYFNVLGMGLWRGRIYTAAKYGVVLQPPVIYHGLFGSGFFQKLYTAEPAHLLMFLTSLEYHALVTLPLLILSVSFYPLLPVALTSLLVSMGVCAAAAVQAELPKKKRRFWSRPLVALLFFLQPIERGWARYHWRLNVRSAPRPVSPRPEAATGRPEVPDRLGYWTLGALDRFGWLTEVMRCLDRQGWQTKTDTGWGSYDLEVFDRWSRLRLTTMTEEQGGMKKVLRCRFHPAWSLRAWSLFCLVAGAELLVIGVFSERLPWLWMLLLSLWVFYWYLEYETRQVQLQIAALLDQVAARLGMVKLKSIS